MQNDPAVKKYAAPPEIYAKFILGYAGGNRRFDYLTEE